jgi:hypothetical protein
MCYANHVQVSKCEVCGKPLAPEDGGIVTFHACRIQLYIWDHVTSMLPGFDWHVIDACFFVTYVKSHIKQRVASHLFEDSDWLVRISKGLLFLPLDRLPFA